MEGGWGEGVGGPCLEGGEGVLEGSNLVGSHGNHGRMPFEFGLEVIGKRLKPFVPLLMLYILLLLLGLQFSFFSSQGSYFLGLRLELALNSS